MKKSKLKKFAVISGIVLICSVLLLIFLSDTIDNMLLPHVKVTEVVSIPSDNPNENLYLVPISAMSGFGGGLYKVNRRGGEKTTVEYVGADIVSSDELYYTVTSKNMYGGMDIVYFTSKDIANGDRVYVIQ